MSARLSLRLALCASGSLLLAACAVGPNYRVPDQAIVNSPAANGAFVSANENALSAAAEARQDWWRLYDDPTLDDLIATALAANTDLRVASASLLRSEALLREARTLRQPSIAIDAGLERSQVAGEQYLLRVKPPRNTDYEANVSIGYDLDLFGAIRRGIEEASADRDAVVAARDLVRINVVAEMARAYADVCGAGLELNSGRHSLAVQQESFELTQRLQLAGRANVLDVTRARQIVSQQESTLPAIEAGQRNALFRLAVLTGRAPADFDRSIADCASPPRLQQPLPIGDGAALLKRRPDVRRAERQLAAATASIGIATAQLYPDVQLGLSLGSLGAVKDFLTAPTNLWNIGSVLKWQANQSAARARVAAAEASAQAALASFDGVVLESLRETETALTTYVHDLRREVSLRAARDDAAKAAADAIRLQLGGRADAFVVVDAQRTLASSEQQLAQIQAAISGDQIATFLALGGGWEADIDPSGAQEQRDSGLGLQ